MVMRKTQSIAALSAWLTLSASGLSGCTGSNDALRHDLWVARKWQLEAAGHLRELGSQCQCHNDQYVTSACHKAMDLALVLESRSDWHYRMSLFELGISPDRPDRVPPKIPALFCPLPEAPAINRLP